MLPRVLALCFATVVSAALDGRADQTLITFGERTDVASIDARDAKVRVRGKGLEVATGRREPWPGITLKAPAGHWDLTAFEHVAADVKNVGPHSVEVSCRVDNPGADGVKNCVTGRIRLEPGEQKTLVVPLTRRMPAELRSKLFGMRGYPGGWVENGGIDPAKINQLLFFVARPTQEHRFEITNVRAAGSAPAVLPVDDAKLFPLIDAFGQFVHKDWPGKIHSAEDFAAREKAETADLAAHPGPPDWNEYGGWRAGPLLKATGRFRTEKHQGRWWLVDRQGRLFWSHGIDCVRMENITPITDRRHWFADLPAKDSPLAAFYGRGYWAPHGYYKGKSYETFNFTGANLFRKYGERWREASAQRAHERLRSWGMNTIANWSEPSVYLMRKTPYTATVNFSGRPLEGSEGYWGKFVDVFDPSFADSLRKAMAGQKGKAAGDPWCVGYFLGNELSWGNDTSLAAAALASPPEQPAKKAFVQWLQAKYPTIERLNAAWGTQHASWNALLESRNPPDAKKAAADLGEFTTVIAERFFQVCRDAVKEVDPEGLYLGCRFAWANERAIRAAGKYCDVVSFNRYERSVANLRLPQGVDRPILIGEFHFGALDRGMFHTGLVPTANQSERAAAYVAYVQSALANPWIVGTHWFQYGDQATTGRGDGENYQIGFVDICDTPYPETIQACRQVGYQLYRERFSAAAKAAAKNQAGE